MLSLRAWNEFSRAAGAAGYADIAEKYAAYVEQKSRELREHPDPFGSFGLFAASDAVNAGFTTPAEQQREGAEHDRLSGTGLTGDYVETGCEVNLDAVNQRVI